MLKMVNSVVLSGLLGAISIFSAFAASGLDGYHEAPIVQQIGDVTGKTADALFAEVTVVPFSRKIDARDTPILLARGKAHLRENRGDQSERKRVRGLKRAEKKALRRAYRAGQTIMILDASTHDVEALHTLLRTGAAHTSTTDPVLLAYIIRRENRTPTSRVLLKIRPTPNTADDPGADERAYARAIDILVNDLSRAPLPSNEPASNFTGAPVDLSDHVFQQTVLTTTSGGVYNTPVKVYAGHICTPFANTEIYDFYLVTTGGNWTPTEAHWESASYTEGQISLSDDYEEWHIDWQPNHDYCTGGIAVDKTIGGGGDSRVCRYMNYPLNYRVSLQPPVGPKTIQDKASPSGDQGKSTSYSSGFSFTIGGGVNISGAGFQSGATWSQSVSTTVPALVVEAGIGNTRSESMYTNYVYCTEGDSVENCVSTIQATGQSGACKDYVIDDAQPGQGPNGSLSDIGQSVKWLVQADTYAASTNTYDITVNWDVELATSTARLWGGAFETIDFVGPVGPTGNCNVFGCSCSIGSSTSSAIKTSHTFKVPLPSMDCNSPSTTECSQTFCEEHPGSTSCTPAPNCAYCDQAACHD